MRRPSHCSRKPRCRAFPAAPKGSRQARDPGVDSIELNTSGLLASRFELIRVAKTGGMGQLFEGVDQQSGDPVAIKMALPAPGAAEGLSQEARALALCDHPSVVRYVAHGESADAVPYLAMEWLDGETLAAVLERGALSVPEVIEIGTRIASALAHLHSRDLVHRDVSPSNILLQAGSADRAKLIDLGAALLVAKASVVPGAAKRLPPTRLVGAPSYVAPEQANGASELDGRADLFSLGAVLYEALTGVRAFDGDNALAVLAKVALSQPDFSRLRACAPPGLFHLVQACLSKSPEDRPPTANRVAEMHADLATARPSLRSSRRHSAVTTAERRLVTVVVAQRQGSELETAEDAAPASESTPEALSARVDAHSVAFAFFGRGSASDQARQAVRRAAQLSAAGPVAIASGWAHLSESAVPSEWIDRCVQMLPESGCAVHMDETTAGLASNRFAVELVDTHYRLKGASSGGRSEAFNAAPLVGRDRELRTLRAIVSDAIETPRALAVLVSGPAGIGKSKLMSEFLRELLSARDAPRLVRLHADPLRANSPLSLARELMSAALSLRKQANPDSARRIVAQRLEELALEQVALTAEFVCELLGFRDGLSVSHELAAARQNAVLMGDQLKVAITRTLRALCTRSSVVVAIEDGHWGDAATLAIFDEVLGAAADLPLALVVAARPELHERFPNLWRQHDLQEVRVIELTRRASTQLVQHLLGSDAEEEHVAWAVATAAGNPFFLEELVRARRSGREAGVPGSVVAVVQNRLEEMEPEARRVLRAASVFGTNFWAAGVSSLVGGEVDDDVRAWLKTLEDREIVEACSQSRLPDQVEFRFRHALIRDAASETLTDSDRRSGHLSAAQWLEAAGEMDASTLAEHYERGGEPDAAGPYWLRAAVVALEGNDFGAAAGHAQRGLASATTPTLEGALFATAAEAERLRGDLGKASDYSARALGLLEMGHSRWFACIGERALVLQRLGQRSQLNALAQSLLGVSPLPGATEMAHWATLRVALACCRVGAFALARACRAAVGELPELTGPLVHASRHAVDAAFALNAGDRAQYLREAEACRARHEQIGDRRAVLEQTINISSTFVELGLPDQAAAMLVDAMQEAKRLNLVHLTAGAQHNLGLALGRLGRFDEALALEREALSGFQRHDHRLEGGARVSVALIALWAGKTELGRSEARQALAILREAAPPLVPVALAALAALDLASGAPDAAVAHCVEAEALMHAASGIEYGETLLVVTHAQALVALGRGGEAAAVARAGAERLQARADLLADPELRVAFLENVPENVQLRRLCAEWAKPAISPCDE